MKLLLICIILVPGILSSSISLAEHPRKEAIETILGKVSKDDSALAASRRTRQLEEVRTAAQTAAKREAYISKEIAPKAQKIIDNKQGPLFNQNNDVFATKSVGKAPEFIVSKGGTAFPVPKSATDPLPVVNPGGKTTGIAFTGGKGGANGQVDTMRIMNPTPATGKSPGYPNGYIKYENKAGQGVNPNTGRTISNKDSHFPVN